MLGKKLWLVLNIRVSSKRKKYMNMTPVGTPFKKNEKNGVDVNILILVY